MSHARLHAKLKSLAWEALAELESGNAPGKPLQVRCRTPRLQVTLQAGPVGKSSCGSLEAFPGLHFSALEAAIFHALAEGKVLLGKQVARAIGQPYTSTLRTILNNLVDRHVLEHTREGYRQASKEPT